MIAPLTPNTQAILLLTAPLIVGRNEGSADLLTLTEYNRLTRILREKQRQPADLIGPDAEETGRLCAAVFGKQRLESLLGRGFSLSQAVDHWNARAIWVVSRADASYPHRLKTRLKEDAPPVLYGCGDPALLVAGGLAVVGSRHVDDELVTYAENVGRLIAKAGRTLVSGAAKGIDRAAMHGALAADGAVVGVMADSLERGALARDNREPLMDHKLVLVSPYDPAAGFNVGHAMQRNKAIYGLADAALVVTSDFEKGGTWAGAIEQLEKLHFVPIFVRHGANVGKGNSTLLHRGAIRWPDPQDRDELSDALSKVAEGAATIPKQEALAFALHEASPSYEIVKGGRPPSPIPMNVEHHAHELTVTPAQALLHSVREILGCALSEPKSETEVAKLLDVSKTQAKAWLTKLVADGELEKVAKPIRYRVARNAERLL